MSKEKRSGKTSTHQPGGSRFIALLYLIIIGIVFLSTYQQIFDEKVDFSGDNAHYFILGKSLASGNGYSDIHTLDKKPHAHFPPGYPIIIAGVMDLLYSKDTNLVKATNGFLFFLSIILVFFISRKIVGNIHFSFAISLIYLFNYHLLRYSTIMLSEISFQFLACVVILLILNMDFEKSPHKNWQFILGVLVLSFAYYVRTIGITIVGAFCLYLLWNRKWYYLGATIVLFVLCQVPWILRNNSLAISGNYISNLAYINPYRTELGYIGFGDWMTRIWENITRYFSREIPNGTFPLYKINYQDPVAAREWIMGIITIPLIIYGWFRLPKYKSLILFLAGCSFGILLNWPQSFYGPRFMFQLIPFFIILTGLALWDISTRLVNKKVYHQYLPLAFLLLIIPMYPMVTSLKVAAKGVFQKGFSDYEEMAKWSKTGIPANSVVACRKPQIFHLHSDQYVSEYSRTDDFISLIDGLKNNSVNYVVVDMMGFSSTGLYLVPAIQKQSYKFKRIHEIGTTEPKTTLFEFRPELGYNGEWNADGIKEGWGTFRWEEGNYFEGEWANNVRNGKGTLYLANGYIVEGEWSDDKLNGRALVKDKDGNPVRYAIYEDNRQVGWAPYP